MTHALRRAGERVLVADALIRLVGLSFDDVGHRVFGTQAVHDLLRRVVRIIDERPRDVAEEATLWQLFHRLTRLFFFHSIWILGVKFLWNSIGNEWITLNWRVLSVTVCPSEASRLMEQADSAGQRHWRSIHGLSYVSTLLHTLCGEQIGRSSSELCWNKMVFG